MNKISVQELAETLRNIAYADDLSHHLQWSLRVIHPRTKDGDVGYSGGMWCNHNFTHKKHTNFSFSFSETQGIYQFQLWRDGNEIRMDFIKEDGKISLEQLKELSAKEYEIDALYTAKKYIMKGKMT